MRREHAAVAAMGASLVGSQAVAIAISPAFKAEGVQAFPDPGNAVNAVVYIVMILVFTGIILAFVKYRRRQLAKYMILASIYLTLVFVLLLPISYGLFFAQPNLFITDLGVNLAALLSFLGAAGLIVALVKYPEWYVVDALGLTVAAGVTAIMGVSFAIVPALILLVGLAIYDAWAVYRTKHMVTLADALTTHRLPVLLVIPKRADYSFRTQKGLKEELASGEEREAMFIGLGDLIIPGVLSVSAFNFLVDPGATFAGFPAHAAVALGTVIGTMVGFAILMRFVLRGNPQAGLPLLNGGAIGGFLVTSLLVYGTVNFGLA